MWKYDLSVAPLNDQCLINSGENHPVYLVNYHREENIGTMRYPVDAELTADSDSGVYFHMKALVGE